MDAFSEALTLVDDEIPGEEAAAILVGVAEASVERLLDAEHRAHALERALPADERAHRVHDLIQRAAQMAMKTPCGHATASGLRDRLHDDGAAVIDADQLAADLERLRASVAT